MCYWYIVERIVVTIDGLAGSGKSSLAKGLAIKLGFELLNSGLLYRALALLCDEISEADAVKKIEENREFLLSPSGDLYSENTAKKASVLAAFPKVREFLLPIQRASLKGRSIVAEGRDMGSVVFPDAKVKVFVEVPVSERALRRGVAEADLEERDRRDKEREIAPAIVPEGALIFQNTGGSLEDKIEELYQLVRARL